LTISWIFSNTCEKKRRANSVGFFPLGTISLTAGSSVYDNVLVFGDVKVGANTWIGPFTVLDGSGGLVIGNNCSISAGVQIYSHDTVRWAVSGGIDGYEYAETRIEDNCYVGPNTIVAKGVTIGTRSIIGANSYVDQSWLQGSKIAGNPARLVG
jgi:acetyltransferase-like isoleucine patch superfamily enzyme